MEHSPSTPGSPSVGEAPGSPGRPGGSGKKIVVLGAGITGVTTAWYLAKAGHEVTVLERNAGAARETSYGNGGQISVSHAEPWANPAAPLKLLRWLGKEDAPLLFRLRADLQQWRWGLKFLMECPASRSRHNMIQILNLGTYSRASLQEVRAETGIDYDHLTRGILHFYTSQKEFDAAIEPARVMREMGCERQVIDRDEVVRLEPALAHIAPQLAGATYTSADESGDVHKFTTGLAERCAQRGVTFRYGVRIQALRADGGRMQSVEIANETGGYEEIKADAYVLALGSFSPMLARQVGIQLDIYPAKGYSATLPVLDPSRAPMVSLTDDEYKLVFSRFGDRLRIAGTAELNGYSLELNRVRCEAITRRTLELFPGMSRPELAQYWAGLRPATPGNVPYIGASKVQGLYLNTGHGTLGWTHGCGSGRAVAEIIDGRMPEVDFDFVGVPRPAGGAGKVAMAAR
ncbi:D-amino acid dehydrogenase [Verticiella sediminum]|uniref:D-amino acid dehydrogenase n=1 Tax=Verticiella sediminum TaxID=1247510 RepID=A0A556AJ85_9BURK|nr:D-amino acid dehydrogenase [Verticiella sediminum]TSH92943.1 D-amino acid dehydrogenase [Verticiella sediminum]